eukprot:scaffold2381_cov128-Cylindrotheca_fusiformis.AAC.7
MAPLNREIPYCVGRYKIATPVLYTTEQCTFLPAMILMTVQILLMISLPSLATFVLAIYATCGMSWSYDTVAGKIVAGVWAGIAIFNTYVLCRYPGYRRVREKIAEEEDKRIEARISKEVKRQAVNQAVKN